MKDIIRFGLILAFVAMAATASLSWVNAITKPRILEQEKQAIQQALTNVLPDCEQGVIVPVEWDNQIHYYLGYTHADTTDLKGVAFQALSPGYSSTIKTMVGMDTTGRIFSICVLSQKETPGLGTRVQEIKSGDTQPWWQAQFANQPAMELSVDKDGGMIESVTGATITSRAITNGIANGAKQVYGYLHHKQMDGATGASITTETIMNQAYQSKSNKKSTI